jgi:hypothetical protein
MQNDPFFPLHLYNAFRQDMWRSPDTDAFREPAYRRMYDLLELLKPELAKKTWDIHLHWMKAYHVSPYHVSDKMPAVSSIQIRLSKSRQLVQWMEDNLLRDFGRQANHIRLECRISEHGFAAQLLLDRDAWVDGSNLVGKLLRSPDAAEHRKFFANHLTNLSSDLHLRIYRPYQDSDHWWSSYAVTDLARNLIDEEEVELNLRKYRYGDHHLTLGVLYKPNDLRINKPMIVQEVMDRFEELYPIYKLIAWTPQNDFLKFAQRQHRRH